MQPDLLALLTEALPVDETRYTECAFWIAFWGQVSTDRRLKRINAWLHREYLRLFERCLARGWREWRAAGRRRRATRCCARSITFINGLTASAVASRGDWPAARQIEQLRLQLRAAARLGDGRRRRSSQRQTRRGPGERADGGQRWISHSPKNSS